MASGADYFYILLCKSSTTPLKEKKKKQTEKQKLKNKAAKKKKKIEPDVWLTNFNSLFGEFNLQCLQICESWEKVFWEFSYSIVVEVPRIEKILNNEKPLLNRFKNILFLIHFALLNVSRRTLKSFYAEMIG